MSEGTVPQWKRDLIERRRALGCAASVGTLHFTCPGVVALQRQPESSPGMRLPSAVPEIQHIVAQIEADRKVKMGEEKAKKVSAAKNNSQDRKSPDEENLSDSSEEFKYGPGIVSKLKSKYLSLTLRETVKVRPPLSNLRRATSLENILDEPDKIEEVKQTKFVKNTAAVNNAAAQSRRGISRSSKENIKRARSVEALVRYNRNIESQNSVEKAPVAPRNRISLEEKELPPPHLVKQTLKLFEPPAPPPPPLLKSPSIPKNITTSAKPVLSPKPTFEKLPRDVKPRMPVQNGIENHLELRVEKTTESKFRHRNSKENLKTTAQVEIIELIENVVEKPEKEIRHVKDQVDMCNAKTTKERSPFRANTASGDTVKPPVIETRKMFGEGDVPTPRIRSSPKERLPTEVPVATPPVEPLRPISPVVARTPPELTSPTMKQVGVIRPIVTLKSPSSHSTPKYTSNHNDRELEKNLLNKVKSVEQPVTKVIVSLKKSAEECTVAVPRSTEKPSIPSWSSTTKPNTMVFNFSGRKDVPDYIENDGLILTSKRDRPKEGDGVILLPGGTTNDSSTDFEPEELLSPPSPCKLVIVGGNVLINGKSSLQKTPKRTKQRIKFSDEVATFEYPSESSMLEENSNPSSSSLNLNLRSGSLSSYTPSQLAMGSDFQLGVTKTTPPPPASVIKHADSSDEEDCLRPADDAQTVAWSAETAADLLF